MKVLILSDIHGNKAALESVLAECDCYQSVILLGDLIDYGPHSNEVIEMLKTLSNKKRILCNIYGNHEKAIITEDYNRFSSKRGIQCAQSTRKYLSETSWTYLNHEMSKEGFYEFDIERKKCLAVHGSFDDVYWKALCFKDDLSVYQKYDYVFSGHSHLPHYFEEFFPVRAPEHRNRKKTVFINPGSAGQPRNHNSLAQYALLDISTEEFILRKVFYDIKEEQSAFSDEVDTFYKERLEIGI